MRYTSHGLYRVYRDVNSIHISEHLYAIISAIMTRATTDTN